jgi:hypothetical protein
MSCVCGEKGTETFSYGNALGHDYREVAGTYKAPTCAEDGKKADMECARCHDMIAGEVIPKTGDHKWKAATGYAPKTCEICGLTEGDVVRYTVESREGLSYKGGEDTAFTITYSRSEDNGSVIDHFEHVLIDGQEVKTTTDRSRNSVTVDAETMNALSAGGHTVLVVFNDWEDTLTVTVEAAATSKDLEMPIAIITAVILAGGLTAAIIVKKRRAI